MSDKIPVAPDVLIWARKTAGLDIPRAAKKLGVSESRLEEFEEGSNPTIVQLRNMATAYKRPLAVLLLSEPPLDFQPIKDFRQRGKAGDEWSPELHSEFKRALSQRDVLIELSEIAPSSVVPPTDDLQVKDAAGAEAVGAALRAMLGMDVWPRSAWKTPATLIKKAIESVESLGVLVVQARSVLLSEMRGFSISEWPYPVIVLNASDWPRPKLFTLFHELAHLTLNAGGMCDLHEPRSNTDAFATNDVEHHCNQVAAEILMPVARIKALSLASDRAWTPADLATFAYPFGASAEAFLLRLVDLKLTTWKTYWDIKPELDTLYEKAREAEKERMKQTPGGPTFYVLKARDLGHGYVQSVLDAYRGRAIRSYDAADYLDVQYQQISKLSEAAS
jgi:Zn-dependent peptidase ImmA (M78 family)/transcriptional regulator with XRE-family HTH domain